MPAERRARASRVWNGTVAPFALALRAKSWSCAPAGNPKPVASVRAALNSIARAVMLKSMSLQAELNLNTGFSFKSGGSVRNRNIQPDSPEDTPPEPRPYCLLVLSVLRRELRGTIPKTTQAPLKSGTCVSGGNIPAGAAAPDRSGRLFLGHRIDGRDDQQNGKADIHDPRQSFIAQVVGHACTE